MVSARPRFRSLLVIPCTLALITSCFAYSASSSAKDEDLRDLVRSGCPDERSCCLFGKWKLISNADVYDTDDAVTKIGKLKSGQEIETVAGRVHSRPGRFKILFDHGDWSKGQTIGVYSVPKKDRKVRYGTAIKTESEIIPFLERGDKCTQPGEECWGRLLSNPRVKWMIQVQMPGPEKKEGWVESRHFKTDDGC
ncbi:MAG: hypothetical protein H7301_00385 [Cryobacterium sp.]|nr:hypothetical protein [Oligoflexia bacterium]